MRENATSEALDLVQGQEHAGTSLLLWRRLNRMSSTTLLAVIADNIRCRKQLNQAVLLRLRAARPEPL